MNAVAVRSGFTALAVAVALSAGAASADDWPQFRRDPYRSGKSEDPVKFPLTEVWGRTSQRITGASPLFHTTVFKERVYFTILKEGGKFLVCADARTGSVRWQQRLEADRLRFVLSDVAGPAVTQSGMVYVYDWIARRTLAKRGSSVHAGQGTQSAGNVEALNSFAVKAFRADTGELLDVFPLAAMGANGVLPRLSLMHPGRSAGGAGPSHSCGVPPLKARRPGVSGTSAAARG